MSTYNGAKTPLDVKAAAYGRWGNEILPHFGIDKKFLSGKHSSCPIHGGKDGFRFTDEGRGCWVCATCTGNKFLDGFNLIEKYMGVSNREAFHMVAKYLRENQIAIQGQETLAKKKTLTPEFTSVQQQKIAATHCMNILSQCIWGTHLYLTNKKLELPALINTKSYKIPDSKQTVRADALIIPLYDLATGHLVSLQFINADGSRGYVANSIIANAVHIIPGFSSLLPWIAVAEGYANTLTIALITDAIVVMACDAGGLMSKAERIQALYPDKKLVFFADNDESNTGQKAARTAQKLTGGYIITPPNVGDDWNDYFKTYGSEQTKIEINRQLKTISEEL
jgi:putative DNA primase/helicase